MEFLLVLQQWWFAHLVLHNWSVLKTCTTCIWEDCDDEHLLRVCVDVSLHELLLLHLIATIPGCLAGFDVLTCSANAAAPFVVLPSCDLTCELQSNFPKSALPAH